MTRTKRPADYAEANIWEACGKCGGEGSVWWGEKAEGVIFLANGGIRKIANVCYKCDGVGGKYVSQKTLDRREKDRERRERKRQEAEAAELRQQEANTEAFATEHPEIAAALPTLGTFGESLEQSVRHFGKLTEKQIAAVQKIMKDRAEAPEAQPVPEGRNVVTGKIISTRFADNDFGGAWKMTVADDRGFKIWGSIPAALDEAERGDRVTFTATLERSERDDTFGFFKRPAKAEIV